MHFILVGVTGNANTLLQTACDRARKQNLAATWSSPQLPHPTLRGMGKAELPLHRQERNLFLMSTLVTPVNHYPIISLDNSFLFFYFYKTIAHYTIKKALYYKTRAHYTHTILSPWP